MTHTLIELGHRQPLTPIQADNTTTVGLTNDSMKQKYSNALNMQWHWLKDQVKLGHFHLDSKPGAENTADYFTKVHSPTHH